MKSRTTSRPGEKRKWYGLTLRHLRMASRMLDSGFADGAIFHAYHAYECALSSFIAACGCPVPPEGWTSLTLPTGKQVSYYPSPQGEIKERSAHKARVVFFEKLAEQSKPYYMHFKTLSRYLNPDVRMNALYYDVNLDRLPHQAYDHSFAMDLIPSVRIFAHEIWKEIK